MTDHGFKTPCLAALVSKGLIPKLGWRILPELLKGVRMVALVHSVKQVKIFSHTTNKLHCVCVCVCIQPTWNTVKFLLDELKVVG